MKKYLTLIQAKNFFFFLPFFTLLLFPHNAHSMFSFTGAGLKNSINGVKKWGTFSKASFGHQQGPVKTFYHWGKKEYLESMIDNKIHTKESKRYFISDEKLGQKRHYGPGLYVADKINTSYVYANFENPLLMEVKVPQTAEQKLVAPQYGWHKITDPKLVTFSYLSPDQNNKEKLWAAVELINNHMTYSRSPLKKKCIQYLLNEADKLEIKIKVKNTFFNTLDKDPQNLAIEFFNYLLDENFRQNLSQREVLDLARDAFITKLKNLPQLIDHDQILTLAQGLGLDLSWVKEILN